MADRPILFSAPMVRAVLAGTKTQTRRLAGVPVIEQTPNGLWHIHTKHGGEIVMTPAAAESELGRQAAHHLPIQPGDRLWVREGLQREETDQGVPFKVYTTDGAQPFVNAEGWDWSAKALAGRYCPKWASRITLHVTDVRVQRLQDIGDADVLAEGCPVDPYYHDTTLDGSGGPMVLMATAQWQSPRAWYHRLWDTINGAGAWDANPWVAAYTFTVEKVNIDQARPANG